MLTLCVRPWACTVPASRVSFAGSASAFCLHALCSATWSWLSLHSLCRLIRLRPDLPCWPLPSISCAVFCKVHLGFWQDLLKACPLFLLGLNLQNPSSAHPVPPLYSSNCHPSLLQGATLLHAGQLPVSMLSLALIELLSFHFAPHPGHCSHLPARLSTLGSHSWSCKASCFRDSHSGLWLPVSELQKDIKPCVCVGISTSDLCPKHPSPAPALVNAALAE